MLKNVRKSRILVSIVIIALIFILLGNIDSLGTEGNPVTITATTNNTTTPDNTNAPQNISANTSSNITSIVSTPDNTANNTSTYNNTSTTSNSSSLPHTGSNSKTIFFVVAFAISAVYAYKKVSDYNF